MKNLLLTLHNDENGAGATEYVILLVLIACFIIFIVAAFGEQIERLFTEAEAEVGQVSVAGGYN